MEIKYFSNHKGGFTVDDGDADLSKLPTLESIDGTEQISSEAVSPTAGSGMPEMLDITDSSEEKEVVSPVKKAVDTSSVIEPKTDFFSVLPQPKDDGQIEHGRKIVNVTGIVIIVISVIQLLFIRNDIIVSLLAAAAKIFGAYMYMKKINLMRIYTGIMTGLTALLCLNLGPMANLLYLESGHNNPISNAVTVLFIVLGISYALITYMIFFNKDVRAYYRSKD